MTKKTRVSARCLPSISFLEQLQWYIGSIANRTLHRKFEKLLKTGEDILAHQTESHTVLYQAYKKVMAEFALKNQRLGDSYFSFNRMS